MLKITETQYRNMRKSSRVPKYLLKQGITIVMPEKLATKWLKALRSDEYGQTDGTMTDGNGNFCCLGVQQHCTLGGYIELDITTFRSELEIFESLPTQKYLREYGIIFADSSGGFDRNPYIASMENTIAVINDTLRDSKHGSIHTYDFKKIADLLEKSMAVY